MNDDPILAHIWPILTKPLVNIRPSITQYLLDYCSAPHTTEWKPLIDYDSHPLHQLFSRWIPIPDLLTFLKSTTMPTCALIEEQSQLGGNFNPEDETTWFMTPRDLLDFLYDLSDGKDYDVIKVLLHHYRKLFDKISFEQHVEMMVELMSCERVESVYVICQCTKFDIRTVVSSLPPRRHNLLALQVVRTSGCTRDCIQWIYTAMGGDDGFVTNKSLQDFWHAQVGYDPLILALQHNNLEIVQFFLDRGRDEFQFGLYYNMKGQQESLLQIIATDRYQYPRPESLRWLFQTYSGAKSLLHQDTKVIDINCPLEELILRSEYNLANVLIENGAQLGGNGYPTQNLLIKYLHTLGKTGCRFLNQQLVLRIIFDKAEDIATAINTLVTCQFGSKTYWISPLFMAASCAIKLGVEEILKIWEQEQKKKTTTTSSSSSQLNTINDDPFFNSNPFTLPLVRIPEPDESPSSPSSSNLIPQDNQQQTNDNNNGQQQQTTSPATTPATLPWESIFVPQSNITVVIPKTISFTSLRASSKDDDEFPRFNDSTPLHACCTSFWFEDGYLNEDPFDEILEVIILGYIDQVL